MDPAQGIHPKAWVLMEFEDDHFIVSMDDDYRWRRSTPIVKSTRDPATHANIIATSSGSTYILDDTTRGLAIGMMDMVEGYLRAGATIRDNGFKDEY